MRNFLSTILVASAVLAGWAGCQSSGLGGRTDWRSIPLLEADAARAAGLSVEEINAAAALYVTKCARCHKFYHPADYTNAEWKPWMTKMSRKARLKPEQDQLLSRYLAAFQSKNPSASKTPGLNP